MIHSFRKTYLEINNSLRMTHKSLIEKVNSQGLGIQKTKRTKQILVKIYSNFAFRGQL